MMSLNLKLGLIYLFLALLNISFFTFIIFENQMDILMENTKFRANETASEIYAQLNIQLKEINQQPLTGQDNAATLRLAEKIKPFLSDFIIFNVTGTALFQSNPDFFLIPEHYDDADRALANNEFLGQIYYSKVNEKNNEILFYLPFSIQNLDQSVLLFKLDLADMNQRLSELYKLVILIILVIAFLHILFGFILQRLIIFPIKTLAVKSAAISQGEYATRVLIKSNDEIGYLGQSFNTMAESIEQTISELNQRNEIMRKELQMAAEVQKSIYPVIRETSHFKIAIYHKPLFAVSGDYHNIIDLGHDRFGIIIADVSGHGVSAALITMMIKDRFEQLAPVYRDSKELMRQMNISFANLMQDFDKFFTAFYLIIDKNRVVTFSNAAHPHALVIRPGIKAFKALDTTGGVFIGLPFADAREYNSRRVKLAKGDKVILFTDGMVESRDQANKIFGEERFQQSVLSHNRCPCQTMLKKILEDFHAFCSPDNRRDDETLLILEMKD